MRIPRPEPEPGEWQIDRYGKRYRMIGNTKEYEPEINGVPQSVFIASRKAEKERREQEIKEEQARAAEYARLKRNCPFKDTNGSNTDCGREDCALFLAGYCTLAGFEPAADTQGKQCPFNPYRHKCRTDCALYKGGCTLTGITKINGNEDK